MSTICKTEALKAHSPASRGQTPSHPSPRDVQQIPDGTIHLIWDFSRSKEQEILMTTFRKEDVLAAHDEAATRVKTNRKLVSKGGAP
jgi:hypothetical protein